MKRIFLIVVFVIINAGIFAQNAENVNRLLLHKDNGIKAYVIDNVDSLTFKTTGDDITAVVNIEGETESYNINELDSISFAAVVGDVVADVEIIECSLTSVTVNLVRSSSCDGFKLACFPYNSISSLTDDVIAEYINENVTDIYYQDFIEEQIDVTLDPGTRYVLATVGFDRYGILCDLSKSEFTTPTEPAADVMVEVVIMDSNLYDFTLMFLPNDDVSSYSVLLGEKGVLEMQYYMFASSFGWADIGDMIEDWGLEFSDDNSYQWTEQSPNTEYELYIQPRDHDNNRLPYEIFEFRSQSMGGEGVAEVTITLGDYELADWWGEMLPSQFFTFTPNDQASAYRFYVVLQENYDADPVGYQEELCSDPFMPTEGWFQYEELTTDYQIDPNISAIAIAAAKNGLGEWGPVSELRFTTPSSVKSYLRHGHIDIMKRESNKITLRIIEDF